MKTPPPTPTTNYHNITKHDLASFTHHLHMSAPQFSFLLRMRLSHMESLPVSHPSHQGAQRSSWKPWLLCSTVLLLLLCSLSTLIPTFLPLKQTAKEPCVAKFGPLPSRWQMESPKPSCVNKISDWKLKILQNGLYIIYGQVTPDPTYKGFAPFEVQLCKNKEAVQTLTNNSKIQNLGGIYEFDAGDIIELRFNSDDQVLKNNTYWGIVLLVTPQFSS